MIGMFDLIFSKKAKKITTQFLNFLNDFFYYRQTFLEQIFTFFVIGKKRCFVNDRDQ